MNTRCPAAELTRGTLSLNAQDVRCRIAGFIRDAEGSPCVGEYTECSIWKVEREKEWANKGKRLDRRPAIHAGTGEWVR